MHKKEYKRTAKGQTGRGRISSSEFGKEEVWKRENHYLFTMLLKRVSHWSGEHHTPLYFVIRGP